VTLFRFDDNVVFEDMKVGKNMDNILSTVLYKDSNFILQIYPFRQLLDIPQAVGRRP
jgi:hypothetical protein